VFGSTRRRRKRPLRILTVLLEMAGISPDLNRTMKAALALLVDPLGDRAD